MQFGCLRFVGDGGSEDGGVETGDELEDDAEELVILRSGAQL
jgi:hypothetical protein